jgi:hypothetical protein
MIMFKRTFAALALAALAFGAGATSASAVTYPPTDRFASAAVRYAPERPSDACIRVLKAYKRGQVSKHYAVITCNRLLTTRREGMRVVRWAEAGHEWALALIS